MTKRCNFIKLAPVLAFAFAAAACSEGWTDITELNENPNEPSTVPPDLVLTEGMQEAFDEFLGNGLNLDYGEHLVQHVSEIAYPEEDAYTYRNTEIDGRFREAYGDYLMDFQEVVEVGTETGDDNVVAVGLVMKSWTFQGLTDIWGDLPYSQAFQGDAAEPVIAPEYDTQQAIYDQLLADVTTASGLLDASTDPFGSQDLVYQGDMAQWQRFANSLHLRLAMRLSEVDAAKAQTEFNAALTAPGGVFTSNADNAQVCYGAVTRNPWFEYYEGRPNDYRVAATVIDALKAHNDPRLGVYASPIENKTVDGAPVEAPYYRGMPTGMPDGHGYAGAETSKPGEYFLSEDACHSLMTFAEVLFLRAEAAARGWTGGDAEQLYRNAIRASLEQWGIEGAEIEAYLAQPGVQWSGDWREQIGLQKWLALYAQGLEAYAEVRRLNYPVLTPGPAATLEQLPARYPYPFSEETFNDANFQAAIDRQGMANMNDQTQPVWWDAN